MVRRIALVGTAAPRVVAGTIAKGSAAMRGTFLVIVVLSVTYYSYRWFLQYNDASTSPTYSQTPVLFEVAKYALLLPLSYVLFLLVLGDRLTSRHLDRGSRAFLLLFASFVAFLVALTLTKTLVGQELLSSPLSWQLFQLGGLAFPLKGLFVFPLALMFPLIWNHRDQLSALLRLMHWLAIYQVAFSAVEIGAFLIAGRLPALAYTGAITRFGGAWDDPNGFSLFAAGAVIAYLAAASVPRLRSRSLTWAGIWLVLLALTISFSGWIAFAVGLTVYFVLMGRVLLIVGSSVVASLMIATLVVAVPTNPLLLSIWITKQNSAFGHLQAVGNPFATPGSDVFTPILGSITPQFSEVSYIAFVSYFGIIATAWGAILIAATLVRASSGSMKAGRSGDPILRLVFAWQASLLVAFLVGSLFIPYFFVFPVNFLFWLLVLAVWTGSSWARQPDPEAAVIGTRQMD